MYGWCKVLRDTDKEMIISYSFGKNETCDGELILNKNTNEIRISKLSEGASTTLTKYFICPLRSRIRKGMELQKKYMIMTG